MTSRFSAKARPAAAAGTPDAIPDTTLWSLPAGALAADVMRHGGLCSVVTEGPRYDVDLADGRSLQGCAFEGRVPHPGEPLGSCVVVARPGAVFSVVSSAEVVSIERRGGVAT